MNKSIILLLAGLLSMTAANAEEKTLSVTVSNPLREARADEPVVLDISGIAMDVNRVVVTDPEGREVASQLDDTDRDCQVDQVCFLSDLGKKQTKVYTVKLYDTGKQADYSARTFAELVLPSRNKKLGKNQQDIYLRSISFDKKTRDTYHYVHSHGVCFESDLVAMRIYFDNRQTVDLYGKENKGLDNRQV